MLWERTFFQVPSIKHFFLSEEWTEAVQEMVAPALYFSITAEYNAGFGSLKKKKFNIYHMMFVNKGYKQHS